MKARWWNRRLVWCALAVAAGCGGKNKGSDDGGGVRIGPDGGRVESSDGALILEVPSGALDEVHEFRITELSEAPTGAVGPVFRVEPSGLLFLESATISITTNQSGPAVALFGDAGSVALETNRSDGRARARIAHLSRYGLVNPSPLSTRADVERVLREVYVPELWSQAVVVSGPADALTPGQTVSEALGRQRVAVPESFEASTPLVETFPPRAFPVDATSWFFWVDLMPTAGFTHRGLYLFVDAQTGMFRLEPTNQVPAIDGSPFLPGLEERFDSPLTVWNGDGEEVLPPVTSGVPSSGEPTRASNSALPQQSGSCCDDNVALLMNTSDEEPFVAGVEAMSTYLTSSTGAEYDLSSVRRVRPFTTNEALGAITGLTRADGQCWCDVLIYITSHGNGGSLSIREANSDEPADDTDRTKAIEYEPLVNALSEVCAERLTLVIDSCESGALHDMIQETRARIATSGILRRRKPAFSCLDATIVTSAQNGRSAFRGTPRLSSVLFGSPDPLSFTKSFLENLQARRFETGPMDWSGAADDVENEDATGLTLLNWQNPHVQHYPPVGDAPCCDCCGTGVDGGDPDAGAGGSTGTGGTGGFGGAGGAGGDGGVDPNDIDGDGIPNGSDNCEAVANTGQEDRDMDQIGDVCDACPDEAFTCGACPASVPAGAPFGLDVARGVENRIVAAVGDAAPGFGGADRFDDFGNAPAIDKFGRVAFRGTAFAGSQDFSIDEGLWAERSGAPELLLREGSPIPQMPALLQNTSVGTFLNSFAYDECGRAAFGVGFEEGGNPTSGLFVETMDAQATHGLELVVRRGDVTGVSKVGSQTFPLNFEGFNAFFGSSYAFGGGAVSARVSAEYVPDPRIDENGLWLFTPEATPDPTAIETCPVDSRAAACIVNPPDVRIHGTTRNPAVNSARQVLFVTQVGERTGGVPLPESQNSAIYLATGPAPQKTLVAQEGDSAGGLDPFYANGIAFEEIAVGTPSGTQAAPTTDLAFWATVGNGTSVTGSALFAGRPGALRVVARSGASVEGLPGATFDGLAGSAESPIALDDSGRPFFRGALSGSASGAAVFTEGAANDQPRALLWQGMSTDSLDWQGTNPPTGGTVVNVGRVGVNASGQLAAVLSVDLGGAGNEFVLLLLDTATNHAWELVRTGVPVEILPGISQTAWFIEANTDDLTGTLGQGRPVGINDAGEVVARISFNESFIPTAIMVFRPMR